MATSLSDDLVGDYSLLRALYYPFSRCMDACALKQLLLVFDGVTFLEPVEDNQWRAELFRNLEVTEDPRFAKYRELEAQLNDLERDGVIVHLKPDNLRAFSNLETSAAAISDLNDPIWREIARQPSAFGLPYQRRARDGSPTWQIFPGKLPHAFRHYLESTSLGEHLIQAEDENYAWTLSYEAGSAATLNLHLAAAGDLGLAPVTDSALHHKLLLRKILRTSTPESRWVESSSMQTEATANSTALHLIDSLIPREALHHVSFDQILRFRESTRGDRAALVRELKSTLIAVANIASFSEISSMQYELNRSIIKEVREYQASIAAARDMIWPNLVKASSTAMVAGTATALVCEYLAGGPIGILAGSIGGTALAALQSSLELRGEVRKIERQTRPSIAYLSRVAQLK